MADDEKEKDSYGNGGSLAGSLLGITAGVGLITHAPSILSSLGAGGFAASAANIGMGGVAAITASCIALGAYIGNKAYHHIHNKREAAHRAPVANASGAAIATPDITPAHAPAVAQEKNWNQSVQNARSATAISSSKAL